MTPNDYEFELEQEIANLGLVELSDIPAVNDLANLLYVLEGNSPMPPGFDFLSSSVNAHTMMFQKAAVAFNFTNSMRA